MSDSINKIGRRRNLSFYIVEVPQLSDRGYNHAIQVYELNKETQKLDMIAADYKISTASWKGATGTAITAIVDQAYSDLKHERGYHLKDSRVKVLQIL